MNATTPGTPALVLDVRALQVAFGRRSASAVTVLRGVDLTVAPGECVAVVGASGAGKSVLARSLLGLAGEGGAPALVTAERLRIDGTELAATGERAWRRVRGSRVGLVLQDALGSLDPLRTIGAEVAEPLRLHPREVLGAPPRGSSRASERFSAHPREVLGAPPRGSARASERVLQALTDVGLDQPELRVRQLPGELSGGMRQRALIASALVTAPPLLVLDEPTTALDATVAVGVLDLLARLRDTGTGLLLITHDLGAVARVADRVVVLEGGVVVEEGGTDQVLTAPRHPATRALLDALPRGPRPSASVVTDEVVLTARGLTRRYPTPAGAVAAVAGVDLTVRRGEALGVVGESGSGKSTLARLLLAAETPDDGVVELAGEPWSGLRERARRQRRGRIRLVPQDPLGSTDPRRSVHRILQDAGAAGEANVARLLAAVQLPPDVATRRPRSLSGGQRQRVAIARALASDPEVLVLDEPVSALDVQVQAGILDLLGELQASRGVAVVLVSHDLAVVRRTCDMVAVMSAGQIVETGPVEQVWAAPEHPVTRALLAAALTPEGQPPP